jgi:endonuclease G
VVRIANRHIKRYRSSSHTKPEISQALEEHRESFPGRTGYDEYFLGVKLPMPHLAPVEYTQVAPLLDAPLKSELEYTHFSVVMNKMRRLPFYTAVNIDGSQLKTVPRQDRWLTDSRIRRDHQLGNEAYVNNDLDRGHMVRRLDPVWGKDAELANSDTFVYTNSALQHKDLNRREWVALENHLLKHAHTTDGKMTIMTGPVFAAGDPDFDNAGRVSPPTQIPQQFWKVAIWNNPQKGLQGTAFVLSQKDMVFKSEEFDPGRFDVYQVPLSDLERKLQMKFPKIDEAVVNSLRLDQASDVMLPDQT